MLFEKYWPFIILLVIVVFGAKRLPDSARSLARSVRIFRSELKDETKDDQDDSDKR